MTASKLLTQDEVAAILKCSVSKVKRLRKSGQLSYYPGRPVLIDEADIPKPIDILTQQEVAGRLGVKLAKLDRMRRRGEIDFLPSRPITFLRGHVDAFEQAVRDTAKQAEADAVEAGLAAARRRAKVKWLQRQMRLRDREAQKR